MARFAVYKKQTLWEEEVVKKKKMKKMKKKKKMKKNDNNDTKYYLRLEIEEDKILKSWKIREEIPSRAGDQS